MPTRVAYLEPDSALRGFVVRMLKDYNDLHIHAAFATVSELRQSDVTQFDVLLLDLDLGALEPSGLDVALEMRARRHFGVVFFTEHRLPEVFTDLPLDQQRGWSLVSKGINIDAELLSATLASTARGLNVIDPRAQRSSVVVTSPSVRGLTARQTRVMALAAQGLDGNAIAAELGLAAVTIRQEFSRAYGVLVPDARPGMDLRTIAVIRFLRAQSHTFESAAVAEIVV